MAFVRRSLVDIVITDGIELNDILVGKCENDSIFSVNRESEEVGQRPVEFVRF